MGALRIRPPTVLVVEDDAIIRMMAADLVEELGFAMFEVSSADAALTMLERHEEITIVFTDVHMPGSIDGLELAALAHLRWPAVGLVVVSGEHVTTNDKLPGGAKFFAKPYDAARVQAALVQMSKDIATAAAAPENCCD